MNCQRCDSDRILEIMSKQVDAFSGSFKGREIERDYAPDVANVCGGDYTDPKVCLECGQVQGEFPVKDPDESCFEECCEHGVSVNWSCGECTEEKFEKMMVEKEAEYEGVDEDTKKFLKNIEKLREEEMTNGFFSGVER